MALKDLGLICSLISLCVSVIRQAFHLLYGICTFVSQALCEFGSRKITLRRYINNIQPTKASYSELECEEKERQAGEEEGECTMREVRPRFRSSHPHTTQVLWHCFYEWGWWTQTRRISVCLSMSLGAEPIVQYKAGLIALSSASQREAFSTWITACVPSYTHLSHLSASLVPHDICLLFFLSISILSFFRPLFHFFLSGPLRLSTRETPPPSLPSSALLYNGAAVCT